MALQFVIHECPPAAINDLVAEALRLLRPGGVLLLSDNDPRCGLQLLFPRLQCIAFANAMPCHAMPHCPAAFLRT